MVSHNGGRKRTNYVCGLCKPKLFSDEYMEKILDDTKRETIERIK